MTRVYARREGDRREKIGAVAVSLGISLSVGAVAYYLARMMISRDRIELEPPTRLKPSARLELKGGALQLPEHGAAPQ